MELATLLIQAGMAAPGRRIEWRDRIAAHGSRAIEAVRPWLANPTLAAFAIRVIERAATNGEAATAMAVLRSARSTMPPVVKGDVDWALKRLRTRGHPPVEIAPRPAAPPTPARPVHRRLSTVARGRPR